MKLDESPQLVLLRRIWLILRDLFLVIAAFIILAVAIITARLIVVFFQPKVDHLFQVVLSLFH